MPDVVLTYTPITGDTFVPGSFNTNWYSTTAGASLIETANGHIEYANLKSDFEVQSHLIRPGHTGFAHSEGRVFSADYFSDLWAGAEADGYIPVAGAALTRRIPFDCSLALFSASVFVTVWRQFGPANGALATRLAAPEVRIQTFFGDNNGIVYTRRELPQTVFMDRTGGRPVAPIAAISTSEARTCHQFNLRHFKHTGGTSPNDALTKGWATFGMAVLVPQNLTGQDPTNGFDDMKLQLNSATSPDARPDTYYSAIHRVRLYARNATIVPLL
jgi:hypothetical protein